MDGVCHSSVSPLAQWGYWLKTWSLSSKHHRKYMQVYHVHFSFQFQRRRALSWYETQVDWKGKVSWEEIQRPVYLSRTWSIQSYDSNNIFLLKIFLGKDFLVEIFWLNFFGVKFFLCENFWGENFWVKIFFGWTFFWVKIFGIKIFWVKFFKWNYFGWNFFE